MDFIDYAVFYYLSEQDQQAFLNSLDFFTREQYENDYNTWFYDPSNSITAANRLTTYTMYISYCFRGSLVKETETFTVIPAEADIRKSLKIQSLVNQDYIDIRVEFTDAPDISCTGGDTGGTGGGTGGTGGGTGGTGGDTGGTGGGTGGTGGGTGGTGGDTGGTGGDTGGTGGGTFTLYSVYCLNNIATTFEQTFPLSTPKNQAILTIYEKLSNTQGVDPASITTGDVFRPTSSKICSTSPSPPNIKSTVLYASYCLGTNSKQTTKNVTYSTPFDLEIAKDRFTQDIAEKENEARLITIQENSYPLINCALNKVTTLYFSACDKSNAITGFRPIEYSDNADLDRKKNAYEIELKIKYPDATVLEGKYPPDKNCASTTGTTGTSSKTIITQCNIQSLGTGTVSLVAGPSSSTKTCFLVSINNSIAAPISSYLAPIHNLTNVNYGLLGKRFRTNHLGIK